MIPKMIHVVEESLLLLLVIRRTFWTRKQLQKSYWKKGPDTTENQNTLEATRNTIATPWQPPIT